MCQSSLRVLHHKPQRVISLPLSPDKAGEHQQTADKALPQHSQVFRGSEFQEAPQKLSGTADSVLLSEVYSPVRIQTQNHWGSESQGKMLTLTT